MRFSSRRDAIDAFERVRVERLELEARARELKQVEADIRALLIDDLQKVKQGFGMGTHWRVELGAVDKLKLVNPGDFFSFCVKKQHMGLPYKRVNVEEAAKLRDSGIAVPGIDWSTIPTLHYRSR